MPKSTKAGPDRRGPREGDPRCAPKPPTRPRRRSRNTVDSFTRRLGVQRTVAGRLPTHSVHGIDLGAVALLEPCAVPSRGTALPAPDRIPLGFGKGGRPRRPRAAPCPACCLRPSQAPARYQGTEPARGAGSARLWEHRLRGNPHSRALCRGASPLLRDGRAGPRRIESHWSKQGSGQLRTRSTPYRATLAAIGRVAHPFGDVFDLPFPSRRILRPNPSLPA